MWEMRRAGYIKINMSVISSNCTISVENEGFQNPTEHFLTSKCRYVAEYLSSGTVNSGEIDHCVTRLHILQIEPNTKVT